jgi:YfiH family protein
VAVSSPVWTWQDGQLAAAHGRAQVRFTSRHGGVSAAPYDTLNLGRWTDDDPAAVAENLARATRSAGVERLAQPHQVHGTAVVPAPAAGSFPEADGVHTAEPGVGCLVLTADCLPVALVAPGGRAVAMVHAGWKGLAGGVLEAGVRALGGKVATAFVGPGAGPCCYEVGSEVHARFGTSGRTLDLKGIAERRLRVAGVPEVHDAGLCTMCDPERRFFSHRRDRGLTGRQAGLAWWS